jgi:entericidin B
MKYVARSRNAIGDSVLTLLLLVGVAIGLSACNTTAGAGQDISATGHAVTNSAEKVKQGL